jgi:hypothetical protein
MVIVGLPADWPLRIRVNISAIGSDMLISSIDSPCSPTGLDDAWRFSTQDNFPKDIPT